MMSTNSEFKQALPKLGIKSGGRCVVCNTETELKCQGCVQQGTPIAELPFYCGKKHQIADWKKGHKTVCGAKKNESKNFAYQFKITLIGVELPFVGDKIEPPIWRRIQIRKQSTFRDLHKAISLSMGWFESHLHEFRLECGEIIGMPNDDDIGRALGVEKITIPEKFLKLEAHFKEVGDRCVYEYDFGDGWLHEVLLETINPVDEKLDYPNCIDGARACPPEDAGGVYEYANLIAAYEKPANRRTKSEREKINWVENHPFGYKNFHPDRFEPSQVKWNMFHSKIWDNN